MLLHLLCLFVLQLVESLSHIFGAALKLAFSYHFRLVVDFGLVTKSDVNQEWVVLTWKLKFGSCFLLLDSDLSL